MNVFNRTKLCVAALAIMLSANVFAEYPPPQNSSTYRQTSYSLFYIYEANSNDFITGVGGSINFTDPFSNLGYSLVTSFNAADVITTEHDKQQYFAWEAGVRFGYFSNISMFGELGFDLTESLFNDYRHDAQESYLNEYRDSLDIYAGIGVGANFGKLRVDAFTRLRNIDSADWEAKSSQFTGVQISINF